MSYKGAALRIEGRPLIAHVLERFASCPDLSPIRVAGPLSIYREILPADRIVDVDDGISINIRTAVDFFLDQGHEGPMAIATCDVLPEPDELRSLLADYRSGEPCDVWCPLIRAPAFPEDAGAFGWKPSYRVVEEEGRPATSCYPCHLIVFDPRALRREFLYQLLDLAYRTRNRSIATRRRVMLWRVLGSLLYQDLLHLLGLRLPNLTLSVVRNGLLLAKRLRAGTILRSELERAVSRIVITSRQRRRLAGQGVRIPLLEGMSLARDIDTEEEAGAAGAEWAT